LLYCRADDWSKGLRVGDFLYAAPPVLGGPAPARPHDHPDPRTYTWSLAELRWIQQRDEQWRACVTQRPPLTDTELLDAAIVQNYASEAFRAGARFAEQFHGITTP
jgi:hypothetical protein